MNSAYVKWANNLSRDEFINLLSDYEKIAVQFGNFNYQVQNGGFSQWVFNNYDSDIDALEDFINNCDFDKKDIFIQMFENYRNIKENIEKLDSYNDFYEEDLETREKHYSDYDSQYYEINDKWAEYFQNYLLDNLTEEYIEKIINYNVSI